MHSGRLAARTASATRVALRTGLYRVIIGIRSHLARQPFVGIVEPAAAGDRVEFAVVKFVDFVVHGHSPVDLTGATIASVMARECPAFAVQHCSVGDSNTGQ